MSFKTLEEEDLFYLLALKSIPNIGNIKAKKIIEKHPTAIKKIFSLSPKQLITAFALSKNDASEIHQFKAFKEVETEFDFLKKNNIIVTAFFENDYPEQLKACYDAPLLFFQLGKFSYQNKKMISIIGTRKNTSYGKKITEQIVQELATLDAVIVSGLAEGIDTIAHEAALANNIPTLAILGHGLKTIYPAKNKTLAKKIIQDGGSLMTEFFSDVFPAKENFPIRNRIVAGICHVLIVIESQKKGGSMITTRYANEYNREVFAVPGRTNDINSEGCNHLIYNNQAHIFNNTDDLLEMMNWKTSKAKKTIQKEFFISLNENQKTLIQLFEKKSEKIHLDYIITTSQIAFSILNAELLDLEFKGVLKALPGKYYSLQ